MTPTIQKTTVCADCPFAGDGISQLICDSRRAPGGLYDVINSRRYPVFGGQGFKGPSQANLEHVLHDPSVVLLTASGHGTPGTFARKQNEDLLRVGSYDPTAVKDKIIHLFACSTAQSLGRDLVGNGCLAFFGYSAEFNFDRYEQDPYAAGIFIDCDSAIDIALASGATPQEAYHQASIAFTQGFSRLKSDPDPGRAKLATILSEDFAALQMILPPSPLMT